MTHDLPLLLGEAPSRTGDRYHMFPLSGAVAERLCGLAGIPPMEGESRYGRWTWALYEWFECENLIDRWPGQQGRGADFPIGLARAALLEKASMLDGRVVVLLGARLKDLLMPEGSVFYCWEVGPLFVDRSDGSLASYCPSTICAIPHPSGLNRLYNDEVERDQAGEVLRRAIELGRLDHAQS